MIDQGSAQREAVVGASSSFGPVAILLVDLAAHSVVQVNDVAEELAPGAGLPTDLEEWSAAAVLRDVDGSELGETEHPLTRVARSEPVAGQAVTAARRSELGEERVPLWVVALPMTGTDLLRDHALVVFFPMTPGSAAPGGAGTMSAEETPPGVDDAGADADIRDRAILAAGLSFTVADVTKPDQPLVWINPAFTAATGYPLEEAAGRNCRFLQGPGTDPVAVARMRQAIDANKPITITLLNYRRDGSPFWNQVDLGPVHGVGGEVTHYVGLQTDVTDRVAADEAREAALTAAEEARGQLSFLLDAVGRLNVSLDATTCREELLRVSVPGLADWAITVNDEAGYLQEARGLHRDPARQDDVDALVATLPETLRTRGVIEALLQGESVRLIGDLESEASLKERSSYLRDLSVTDLTARLGAHCAAFVALPGRDRVKDVLVLLRDVGREEFSAHDLDIARDLGRRAGLVIDNARVYDRQRTIAHTLQASLLPDVEQHQGRDDLEVVSVYLPAEDDAEVGGDFAELLDTTDGAVDLYIGDVVGHDIFAAAAMGNLRGLLRASAFDNPDGPAAVLDRVDRLITGLQLPTMATIGYARLRRGPDGWDVATSVAGHPPFLVREPDGTARFLTEVEAAAHGPLLGVGGADRHDHTEHLARGTVLIGYTDGLVERVGRPIGEGLERLRAALGSGPSDLEALSRHLLAQAEVPRRDDVALILLTLR